MGSLATRDSGQLDSGWGQVGAGRDWGREEGSLLSDERWSEQEKTDFLRAQLQPLAQAHSDRQHGRATGLLP